MLELNYLRNNVELVRRKLVVKHFNALHLIDEIIALDTDRRHSQQALDDILHQSNRLSKDIGSLYKQGKAQEANALKAQTAQLKEQSHKHQEQLHEITSALQDKLVLLPNIPHDKVPLGHLDTDNVIVREGGVKPILLEDAKPHWELAEQYNIISLELGVKITGAGFPVYLNKGARLQRALINFFLDEATLAGYTEMQVPHLVNEESAFGTGQLPDKEGQMYHARDDNFYLIPTAEVPLTNIYRDEIVLEADLPIKMCGYTPCFRREAGSYGKHVRGLNRVHQFDKVEIVQIAHPDQSYATLDLMVAHVEQILQKLQLPYRILALCGGDVSFASALTYDFEVFSTAQNRWLEVSSVSNFETFQSNRMKLRYRDTEQKKAVLAHTLNGSALALPRIVAAILENYQTPQGIVIPEVLQPYTGFAIIN